MPSNRRLALAVGGLLVAAIAGGALVANRDEGDAKGGKFVIAATDFRFTPARLTVPAGQRVTFENRGPSDHTFTADDGRFDSGVLSAKDMYGEALDGPRRVKIHCEIHPNMTAVLVIEAAEGE